MSDKTSTSSGGIGAVGLLGVAFIVLRLCGVISWSWWWVLAPFWGGVLLWTILCIVMVLVLASSKN